ncbi:carbonic anhydrase/acetyltransferase-like protein (isoleucine patch superfamily) [Arthrobacter sp. UYP6]|uniref:hypothetical protein n=1 Tax=Arthrobacter sp. UYP6 TaxID=1756378 RepID=UPI0033980D23
MPELQRNDPDSVRQEFGYLTVAEILQLCATQQILDPSSTLISRRVQLGEGNVFYPGTVISVDEQSSCVIGHRNVFYPGAFLSAEHGGMLLLGSEITLGPGGVQLTAGRADAVAVGDRARLAHGAVVSGRSVLGSGSQILGAVQAESVVLADGGDHESFPPEQRGSVLKGSGLVRGLRLAPGDLMLGFGNFTSASAQRQADLPA